MEQNTFRAKKMTQHPRHQVSKREKTTMKESLHKHSNPHGLSHVIEQSEKLEDFEKTAAIFEKLGDARRMQIFWILCHCEECVTDLSAIIGMSAPAVSHHLKVLRECGLIESKRDGREVVYRATNHELTHLLHITTEEIMAVSCPDTDIVPEIRHIFSESLTNQSNCVDCGHPHANECNHNHIQDCIHEKTFNSNHNHALNNINHECIPDHSHDCSHSHATDYGHSVSTAHTELAEQIHEYLNAHLDQHITIDSLAKHFCVNPTTIKTVFRDAFGNSIAAHTKEHRMEKAADLICNTDLSLSETALAVGYQSQSKFTRAFKETYGILPKDYKKKHTVG